MKKVLLILAIIFTLIAIIFSFWLAPISAISSVLLSMLIAAMLTSIWRVIFRRARIKKFSHIFATFFLIGWSIFGLIVTFLWYFIYYQNFQNPAALSNIVLENNSGQKISFVKMSHIASEDFLKNKKQYIEKKQSEGFKIMIEGVGTGSIDSEAKINQLVGFDFVGNGYADFASIFGLAEQTEVIYENILPENIVHVDISLDQVVEMALSGQTSSGNLDLPDLQSQIEQVKNQISSLSRNEKIVMEQALYALLNFQIKNAPALLQGIDSDPQLAPQAQFMQVILHERNKPVIDYILSNPAENLAIVYGALHYDGVVEGLQAKDPTWKIVEILPEYPYKK